MPSSSGAANLSQAPKKLSGNKHVQFFNVGNLDNRTYVVYMTKKNVGGPETSRSTSLIESCLSAW